MPGTMPNAGLPAGLAGDFNPIAASGGAGTPPSLPHSLNGLIPPSGGSYLPQFPFAHPDLLHKHPFLPYDFATIQRNMSNRSQSSSTHTPSSPPIATSNGDHLSSSRLSPASSRPSSSSPPSAHCISIKINSSLEISSNHENSSEDSDDEQIDVVKSAFVPILSRSVAHPTTATKLEKADSTVDECGPASSPSRLSAALKYELKAPSSRKPHHESAPRPHSPPVETKLKPAVITQQKTVWRPY